MTLSEAVVHLSSLRPHRFTHAEDVGAIRVVLAALPSPAGVTTQEAELRRQLDEVTTYATKVDAELAASKAEPARQLADAAIARAVHEYDLRIKAEKELAEVRALLRARSS